MAMFAPTRKARPTVWRIRTNGNAQSDGSSRIQIPSGHASIQRKNESMRAECYRTHSTAETDRPQKGRSRNKRWALALGFGLWDFRKKELAEPRRLRQFQNSAYTSTCQSPAPAVTVQRA